MSSIGCTAGPTSLSNVVLLCQHHHRLVHEGGWTLDLGEDGAVTVIRPGVLALANSPCRAGSVTISRPDGTLVEPHR